MHWLERWWREKDSNLRRRSRQIYSLIPLATRESLHGIFAYCLAISAVKAAKRHFHKRWWREKDSNLRRRSRQIYSLIPLATRESLHGIFAYCLALSAVKAAKRHSHKRWWREKDSNLRRRSRQIYSLIPLATRESLHGIFYVLSGFISRESRTAYHFHKKMVEGEGFEPSKAEPSDLQSDPFGHSGTPPQVRCG